MRYDKAPRPLSAVIVVPPRRVNPTDSDGAQSLGAAPRPVAPQERVVFGQTAVWNALQKHLNELEQLLYTREQIGALANVFPILAARQVICRELDSETLARVARSPTHQGLVALLAPAQAAPALDELAATATQPGVSLLLAGPIHAHELADLVRTARFFGAAALWLAPEARRAMHARAVTDALQAMPVHDCARPVDQVQAFARAGGRVVVLSADGPHPLSALAALRRDAVLFVVSGDQGQLDPALVQAATVRVRLETVNGATTLPPCVPMGIALQAMRAQPTVGAGMTRPLVR